MAFQVVFLLSTFLQSRRISFTKFLDSIFIAVGIVADWYWHSKKLWENFDDKALVFYTLLVSSYKTFQLWNRSLQEAVYNHV